ncbi:MAG: ABC transporter permease, partial [Chloroflexota bacterium]
MVRFLVRRLVASVGVLLGVSVITFMMVYVMPSDPARLYAGPRAPEETVERIREEWGLNDPLYVQYATYMWRAIQGDLGRSVRDRRPVLTAVMERVPATLQLALAGLFVELLIGIPLGILAASRPGSIADGIATLGSLVAISIPQFVLGIGLLYFFGFLIPIFPLGGYGTPLHIVLPAITLGLGGSAFYSRITRNNLMDTLGENYIRTAHAKGLFPGVVMSRHALRNAILPVITLAGMDLALLIGGVVVVEAVFGWPGLGLQAWDAIRDQDTPIIMGTVLFGAVVVVFLNMAIDV